MCVGMERAQHELLAHIHDLPTTFGAREDFDGSTERHTRLNTGLYRACDWLKAFNKLKCSCSDAVASANSACVTFDCQQRQKQKQTLLSEVMEESWDFYFNPPDQEQRKSPNAKDRSLDADPSPSQPVSMLGKREKNFSFGLESSNEPKRVKSEKDGSSFSPVTPLLSPPCRRVAFASSPEVFGPPPGYRADCDEDESDEEGAEDILLVQERLSRSALGASASAAAPESAASGLECL
ncbi:hypothetical protein FVE85_5236 [Porphyridium purpureum]|uniref:Uncharacterized protein n=1 Tax=Porphyridium purpureum TaxID=35688 RepID=A0A5J4Z1E1_PORPP|nr:hypothetical protein FVE85_5236 [Porphyridium purpureum]|eukprot:POR3694..scf295_1